jgi:peptide/nickel transport system permease protein
LYQGQYYWILEPAFLLMLTGLAFAMLGFVLDRIFNPRLRGI